MSIMWQCFFSGSFLACLMTVKCGYMINFGIAPYLKKMLLEKLKLTPFFAVCYDESMNRIFQEEQMDIVLQFFNENTGQVETPYFDLRFFLNILTASTYLLAYLKHYHPFMDKMIQHWMAPMLIGTYLKTKSFKRRGVLKVDKYWFLWFTCCPWGPPNRNSCNQVGHKQGSSCNVDNISIHSGGG